MASGIKKVMMDNKEKNLLKICFLNLFFPNKIFYFQLRIIVMFEPKQESLEFVGLL